MAAHDRLSERLARRILVLDGALGTMLQSRGDDDAVTREDADAVRRLHEAYLDAGADIIRTNTFSSASAEAARAAVHLARTAADGCSTADRPRFVAGVLSPSTRIPRDAYLDRVNALIDGGADLILLETVYDVPHGAEAAAAVRDALERHASDVPLMISATVTANGRLPSGERVEEFHARMRGTRPLAIGLNCGVGVQTMRAPLEALAHAADACITCHPNAGLPDAAGRYPDGPEMLARSLREFAMGGLLNVVGGCCGTTPDHIRTLAAAVAEVTPRRRP